MYLPPPPGFGLPPPGSKPPLLEEVKTLIKISNPQEAWPILMPIGTMNLIVFRNEHMGNIEYEYKTQTLESLNPDPANSRPKITEL